MAREKNIAVSPFLSELFHLGLYKRSQGRLTRQVTWSAMAIGMALGAWRLSYFLLEQGTTVRYVVPAVVLAIGLWVAFRLVNMPRFADFLIAVEAEVNKVSWPSKGELVRSTVVVLITIFALAVILFAYDFLWSFLLRTLGVTGA
jgi:preprotein translocase subunit SecE